MHAGIIGAMEEECALLRSLMESPLETKKAGFSFTTGRIHGLDVVLLQSGIGKVNAAIGTTILLDSYNPGFIINTGSAGGTHEGLEVGDIIVSTEVKHHDVDATSFGYEYGQVPRMPASFIPHKTLVDIAERVIHKLEGINSYSGLIGTGDSFMDKEDHIHIVKEKLPDILAMEMEAAAIAQTCHVFSIPFLIVRSISDIAGKESPVSFKEYLEIAARHSAVLVMELIAEVKKVYEGKLPEAL
jgi:adenosylhomocysteine nucleosidase